MDVNRTAGPPRSACALCGRSPWCAPASGRGRHFRPARLVGTLLALRISAEISIRSNEAFNTTSSRICGSVLALRCAEAAGGGAAAGEAVGRTANSAGRGLPRRRTDHTVPDRVPGRRRSSLPSAKMQSLRTGRASHPQGLAASSPRQHSRRRFRGRRPRIAPAPKSQIPIWTGFRRRLRSSGGFGQAAATRLVNRSAPWL